MSENSDNDAAVASGMKNENKPDELMSGTGTGNESSWSEGL